MTRRRGDRPKFVWYEQYKRCGCSHIERFKKDLPGHCTRHFTDRERVVRLPDQGFELGHVGGG